MECILYSHQNHASRSVIELACWCHLALLLQWPEVYRQTVFGFHHMALANDMMLWMLMMLDGNVTHQDPHTARQALHLEVGPEWELGDE